MVSINSNQIDRLELFVMVPHRYSPEYPGEKLQAVSFGKTRRKPWPNPSLEESERPGPTAYTLPSVRGLFFRGHTLGSSPRARWRSVRCEKWLAFH